MCTILRTSRNLARHPLLKITSISSTQIHHSSTKAVPQIEKEDEQTDVKQFINMTKMERKIRTKKPQREPFVKNLFLGVFDTEILTYPEVIEKQDWIDLKNKLKPVQDYMATADVMKESGKIPKQHLAILSNLNLLGLQAPPIYGGADMNNTESLCYNEALATSTNSIGVVNTNYSVANILMKVGTPKQQAQYLEKIIKGQVAALCLHENDCMDVKLMKTKGKQSGDTWILNGTKNSVVNGESADIFIVFARTRFSNEFKSDCTAFIVDRSMAGITTNSISTFGLENTDICDVSFDNVKVPAENVIGSVNEGEQVLTKVLAETRLGTAPLCITLTRSALNELINHCKSVQLKNFNYHETDMVANNVAQVAVSLYAMESMAYLTSSLMDMYENQDCDMEAVITKVFCSERAHKSASNILQFIGTSAFDKNHWSNKYYRDALGHTLLNECNNNLRLATSLLGLQYAGIKIEENIKMLRNPLYHSKEKFKKLFSLRHHMRDRPKLTLGLHYNLHPSLKNAADSIEYCVLRLQFATEKLLIEYGTAVVLQHMELERLAECITHIYAGIAVLGRASRSYCIGLRNADMEVYMANAFCFDTREKVRRLILDILSDQLNTNDQNYRAISQRAFHDRKYFAEHPLEKNF